MNLQCFIVLGRLRPLVKAVEPGMIYSYDEFTQIVFHFGCAAAVTKTTVFNQMCCF